MLMAIPFFCMMLILFPFVMLFDKFRRRAEHLVNKIWAVLSTLPFNKVVVRFLQHAHCGRLAVPPSSSTEPFY